MVKTERPRGRNSVAEEIGLDTWKAFRSADLLNSLVVKRMLAGVATRRHLDVAEPGGEDLEGAPSRCPSRRRPGGFVAATTTAPGELIAWNLSDLDVAVVMIDRAGRGRLVVVVALGHTTDGTEVSVGLCLGDTETQTVSALLADLVGPGPGPRVGDGREQLRWLVRRPVAFDAVSQAEPCQRMGQVAEARRPEGIHVRQSQPRAVGRDWPRPRTAARHPV